MIWAAIIVSIALLAGIGSGVYLGKDNPVEEFCEEIIEEITGIDGVDLSPWENEIQEKKNDLLY